MMNTQGDSQKEFWALVPVIRYMVQEYVHDIAASEIRVFLRFLLLLVICGVCSKRTKATAKPKMQ